MKPCGYRTRRGKRKILPEKRQKGNFGNRPGGTSLPRGRRIHSLIHILCASLVVLWTAAPAAADPSPELISATPQAQASHRSANVLDVRANYDRDLSQGSTLELRDGSNALIPGTVGLDGPDSPTLGKRTIRFEPAATLAEGSYTAKATAYAPGGYAEDTWSFTIDDTAPLAPTLTSPANGQLVFDQPVLLRGTGEPHTRLVVLEDGEAILEDWVPPNGSFAVQLPYPPEDGVTHTVTARLKDTAGNIGADTPPLTFRHDSVTVIPEITVPSEGAHVGATTVTLAGFAKAGSTVTVFEGATAVATAVVDATGRWTTTGTFAEGPHTISASSYDGAITDGPSASRSFVVDTTLPAAPFVATPAELQQVATNPVGIAGTAEPNATIEIREGTLLRGTTTADAAGDWGTAIRFSDGPHTIAVRAFDRAGNGSATTNRQFSVDTTAPVRPIIDSPADGSVFTTNTIAISGRSEPSAGIAIVRGMVTLGTTTADALGNWTASITFTDGAHTIVAVAEDAAGNRSEPSLSRSFVVDTAAPAAPVITQPGAGQNVGTSVTIAGTAEQASLVVVKEGATTVGNAATGSNNLWTMTVTMAPGAHTITATAADNAGNVSPPSAPRTFTVVVGPVDTTPPPPPVLLSPSNGDVVPMSVTFSGTAEPNARIRIDADFDLLASTRASSGGAWSVTTTMTHGPHDVFALAVDAAGNVSGPSPTITIDVDGLRPTVDIDTPSESIFLLTDDTVISGSATDDHDVVRVELEYFNLLGQRVVRQAAQVCAGCPGSDVTWEARPSLQPNVYRVEAVAVDQSGNRSDPQQIRIIRL